MDELKNYITENIITTSGKINGMYFQNGKNSEILNEIIKDTLFLDGDVKAKHG